MPIFLSSYRCINRNRVIILILLWIFIVKLVSNFTFIRFIRDFEEWYNTLSKNYYQFYLLESMNYVINAILLGFYPLAGYLADNKVGRFRTITRSSECLMVLLFLMFFSLFAEVMQLYWGVFSKMKILPLRIIVDGLILPIEISLIITNANIIQFGVDQLQDSPADHQSLFIHWYVWLNYLAILVVQLMAQFFTPVNNNYFILQELIFIVLAIVILCIVVSLVHYNKHWFIIDTARSNPYKIVCRVTKFARQHKVPIRRSAFTYCEDDIPSGLDLGKSKYGGPFTTEQVEDVKAFYGISKLIFTLGFVFSWIIQVAVYLGSFMDLHI